MNKITLMFAILLLASPLVYSQEEQAQQNTENNRRRNEVDRKVYQMAMRYNDLAVARVKLFELIERNPTNLSYMEALAEVYYESGQWTSAAIIAIDILEMNDKSIPALGIAANSLEELGAMDRALPHFERHYLLTGNLFSLYKTAYLQYSLNRQEEALNSITMLEKNNKAEQERIGFQKNDGNTQEVSLKAAALNLKGMVHMYQKNKKEAIESLEQALALQSDFELAQQNLREARAM